MNVNNELLEYMYKDAAMASYTITELIRDLKGKDNKIFKTIEDILKEYQEFESMFKEKLLKENVELKEQGAFSKMMANMGIKKEVKSDNSDASIADMLIKGISMGSLNIDKKISQYDEAIDKDVLKLAEKFKKFQENSIEKLKEYL